MPAPTSADAVLGLLLPFWQLVLSGCVLLFMVGAAVRLAGRGRSRMSTGVLVAGAALVGLMVLGLLTTR
jgi:hypothetical protein